MTTSGIGIVDDTPQRRVLEGFVEAREPLQLAADPDGVGPLMPREIPLAEAARRLRSELKERYRTVAFSVRSERFGPSGQIFVDYADGPVKEEVQAVANDYLGSWYESYPGDGGRYHDLPGRWIGGEFIRYDVDRIRVHRSESATRKDPAQAAAEYLAWLEQKDGGTITRTHLGTAAALLGLSQRAVVKLLQAGKIEAAKGRGGRWDISIASLRAYAERGE